MPWPYPRRTPVRHPRSLRHFNLHSASVSAGFIALLVLGCVIARAQGPSAGTFDRDIPLPSSAQSTGVQNVTALSEIVAHLKAVGAAPWTSMQGTGTITYGNDSNGYNATLSIQGRNSFRLDAQTATGPMSIRIHGRLGKIQEQDGHVYPLPPETAASGIFQFELPRMADFPRPGTSLLDRGFVVIDGRSLHRLTYESSAAKTSAGLQKNKTSVVTDFYFDPSSHLLVKSANSIHLDGTRNDNFLRVITYEDYRKVGDAMVPFRYTQSLDGQKQWTLQLSEVQLNPDLKTSFFQF